MIVPTALNVGLATTFPLLAASYQTTVAPEGAVAVAVSVCMGDCWQTVWLPPLVGAVGASLMVKVTAVRDKLRQLLVLSFEAT